MPTVKEFLESKGLKVKPIQCPRGRGKKMIPFFQLWKKTPVLYGCYRLDGEAQNIIEILDLTPGKCDRNCRKSEDSVSSSPKGLRIFDTRIV